MNRDDSRESAFLIRVLTDHLLQKNTLPPDELDWDALYHLARIHEVAAIVFFQCKDFLPASRQKQFETAYATACLLFTTRIQALAEVSRALESAAVAFAVVKGPEVAQYYPAPPLRTMSDFDLIVPPDDVDRAIRALREIGFEEDDLSTKHAWSCVRNQCHLELHDRLVMGDEFASEAHQSFLNDFTPYIRQNKPDPSFHFLFLLSHLRKHFVRGGVGIRQFLDLAVYISRGPELRWDWIASATAKMDLDRFAGLCYSLIAEWFGVDVPVIYEKQEKTVRQISDMIFRNGVFGRSNAGNKGNTAQNALIQTKGARSLRRLSLLVNRLFPSYRELRGYPACSFLNGRPYLLPAAWISRGVFILRKGRTSSAQGTLQVILSSDDELKKREELLQAAGIRTTGAAK